VAACNGLWSASAWRSEFGKRDGQSVGLCRRVTGIVSRRSGFLGLGLIDQVFADADQSLSGSADGFDSRVCDRVDHSFRCVQQAGSVDVRPLLDLVTTGLGEAVQFVAKV
jgi:hypothetical protein